MGIAISVISGLVSMAAGVYLLSHGSGPIDVGGQAGQSWLEILAHGIGAYFIAKGLWMIRSLYLQEQQRDALQELVYQQKERPEPLPPPRDLAETLRG